MVETLARELMLPPVSRYPSLPVRFFICGLPGGMDYVMLAMVKHGLLDAMAEKRYNARINVWLRAPGLVCCAFAVWVASRQRDVGPGMLAAAVLVAVNGLYYMQVRIRHVLPQSLSRWVLNKQLLL